MDFGVVLQTNPPASRGGRAAGAGGGARVHPRVDVRLPPAVAGAVRHLQRRSSPQTRGSSSGPMVTNPATRDWTVTASLFATLNEMYGNRTVCGIGRGDSAVRVTNGKPDHARRAARRDRTSSASWPTAGRSSTRARRCGSRGCRGVDARGLGGRVRAEGAGAGRRGRRRVHPPARRPRHRRVDDQGGARGRGGRRPRPGRARRSASPRPAYVGDDLAHMREQCRWFGGMVGNHVADIVARYGDHSAPCRRR